MNRLLLFVVGLLFSSFAFGNLFEARAEYIVNLSNGSGVIGTDWEGNILFLDKNMDSVSEELLDFAANPQGIVYLLNKNIFENSILGCWNEDLEADDAWDVLELVTGAGLLLTAPISPAGILHVTGGVTAIKKSIESIKERQNRKAHEN